MHLFSFDQLCPSGGENKKFQELKLTQFVWLSDMHRKARSKILTKPIENRIWPKSFKVDIVT